VPLPGVGGFGDGVSPAPARHEDWLLPATAGFPLSVLKSANFPKLGGGAVEAIKAERTGVGIRVSTRRRSWTLKTDHGFNINNVRECKGEG